MAASRKFVGMLIFACVLLGFLSPEVHGQPKKERVKPEEKSFRSVDGVKLRGLFYKSGKANAPTVLMLHAYKAKQDEDKWDDLSQFLVEKGMHVFRFDFRGHGNSCEIEPEFWTYAAPGASFSAGEINKKYASGGAATKNKVKITYKDFRPEYFPMLVQDIAAARNTLDQMNDNGEINTSNIFLCGVGDAATLGMLYLSSEWMREAKMPNVPKAISFVSPDRPLFDEAKPAGYDFAGAIWLSPSKPDTITQAVMKKWVINNYAVKMRTETPMLFLTGDKDARGKTASQMFFRDILVVDKKALGAKNEKLAFPDQTFRVEVKDSAAFGVGLLGNNLGTETQIDTFLTAVTKERKDVVRRNRDWEKPLFVDVRAFGVLGASSSGGN